MVFHVVAVLVASVPGPSRSDLSPANRARPWVHESVLAGARPLVTLGLVDDAEAGVDLLWRAGEWMVEGRRLATRPFRLYYRYTGTGGMWRMFATLPTRVARLEVHGQAAGSTAWQPLYVEHTGHDWSADLLDEGRIRSLRQPWSLKSDASTYPDFARYLAHRALAEHPDLASVRVRYRRLRIADPAAVRAAGGVPLGAAYWERAFPRPRPP